MSRPKGPPGSALEHKVEARLSYTEKKALERLINEHGAFLASHGISDGSNFGVWLRSVIRREALQGGFPVDGAVVQPSVEPSAAPAKHLRARDPR